MNSTHPRMTRSVAAAFAGAIVLFTASLPAHADEATVGGVAAAQRYRAAQPTVNDVRLDLRAGTTADVRALASQAEAGRAAPSQEAGRAAPSQEAGRAAP